MEPAELIAGSDVEYERKKGFKDDAQRFSLSNGATIFRGRKNGEGIKFCFGDVRLEPIKYPGGDVEKEVGNWSLEYRGRGLG